RARPAAITKRFMVVSPVETRERAGRVLHREIRGGPPHPYTFNVRAVGTLVRAIHPNHPQRRGARPKRPRPGVVHAVPEALTSGDSTRSAHMGRSRTAGRRTRSGC